MYPSREKIQENPSLCDECKCGERGWGKPDMDILFSLPIAIHKAGICITSVDIQVSLLADFSLLAPTDADLCDLTAAMQRLKDLNFWIRGRYASIWPTRPVDEVEHLVKFVSAILHTASVRQISLDLSFLWDEFTPPRSSAFPLRTWPQLDSLFLCGMPVSYMELVQVFAEREKIQSASWTYKIYIFSVVRGRIRLTYSGKQWLGIRPLSSRREQNAMLCQMRTGRGYLKTQ